MLQLTEAELAQHFSSFGTVTKLCLAGNTSQPTRFAFVEFSTAKEATAALALHGSVVGSR